MSELLHPTFWPAIAGLCLMLFAAAAMLRLDRLRAATEARLARANGTACATQAEDTRPGPALAQGLRHVVVRIGERLAVILGGEARETAAELASAGYRNRDALLIYAFLKTVLPLAALLIGGLRVALTVPLGLAMLLPAGIVIAGALALSKGVDIVVDQRRRKRLARVRLAFPDMLEMLVITSEAGLGPQPALHRVAREMRATHSDLAEEILQMVSEMRMTNDRRAAYERLGQRVPLPEIGVFTQTLDQSDTYGTPFSRAMRTLIAETRANRLMMIEEKAARLPVIMTLPLIFCIMPAVFVVLVGPAALSIIDNILTGG
ncbi:type II secretion system F family protein [Ponticoccus gilvus]|nr:type II secretion system F family protein [Enemella evansiae]